MFSRVDKGDGGGANVYWIDKLGILHSIRLARRESQELGFGSREFYLILLAIVLELELELEDVIGDIGTVICLTYSSDMFITYGDAKTRLLGRC